MYRITSLLLLLVLPVLLIAQSTEARTYSLEQAIQEALINNKSLYIDRLEIEKAKETVRETAAIGYPQVDANVGYINYLKIPTFLFQNPADGEFVEIEGNRRHNLNADIGLTQMLFNGSYIYGLKAAKQFKELTESEILEKEIDLKYQVSKSYLSALAAESNYQVVQKNIATLSKSLYETEQLYINGFAEKLDVERLELAIANTKSTINNLERQVQLAKNALKFQIGIDQEVQVNLTDDLDAQMRAALAIVNNIEMGDRYELDVVDGRIALNETNVKLQKSMYWPTLYGFLGYGVSAQRDAFDFGRTDEPWFGSAQFGLELKIPIFDGFLKDSKVKQAKLDIDRLNGYKALLEDQFDLELEQAKTRYNNAYSQYLNQQKNMDLAQKIYDTAMIKYKEGIGSSIEVTQAESALVDTQINFTNALFEIIIAKNDIDKAVGKF